MYERQSPSPKSEFLSTQSLPTERPSIGLTKAQGPLQKCYENGEAGQGGKVVRSQEKTSLTECYWNSLLTRPKTYNLTKVLPLALLPKPHAFSGPWAKPAVALRLD